MPTEPPIERLKLPAASADENRRAKPRHPESGKLVRIAWLLANCPKSELTTLTGAVREVAATLTESDRAILAGIGVT